MPITVTEFPEPLTPASRRSPERTLIGSDALRLLQHELRRYCSESVSGRSFLIAGHRGAGKTTLVHGAFQQVLDEISEEERARFRPDFNPSFEGYPSTMPRLRPLLILLQGPNLLPPPPPPKNGDGETAKQNAGDSGAKQTDNASTNETSDGRQQMETVLIQITLGLYRAVAAEFSRCYRLRFSRADSAGVRPDSSYVLMQRLELAAMFELDLDQYPGTERLREYWRLADALDRGILFSGASFTRPLDQGLRELVALSTASEAYQRICGKLSREDQKISGLDKKTEQSVALDTKGSELQKPITALLAGGVAAAGVLTAQHEAYSGAALAGLLTALGSSLVFRYSSSHSLQRTAKRADLFIPDLSLSSLDRVLPVLLNRIRQSGLAPVFMVDELDKIDGLSDRITDMVKRLKKLVAENSFFCFLTDRKYFEEMSGRTTGAAYPIEYTYFTNQLFIIFRHEEMHRYLDNVLQLAEVAQVPGQAPDPQQADDAIDRQVLPYILLHAAQMHPIDLRRQLLAIQDEQGRVKLAPGAVRSRPRFRYELMIQVAVEMALSDTDMQAEIELRPAFLQIAHDALYYISRRWSKAPDRLHLEDARKSGFAAYLKNRMATDASIANASPRDDDSHQPGEGQAKPAHRNELGQHKTKAHHRSQAEPGVRHEDNEDHPLQDDKDDHHEFIIESATLDFLFQKVKDLALLLASPKDLLTQATASKQFSQNVLDAVSPDPLLKPVLGEDHVYDWCAFPSSRPVQRGAAPLRVTPTAAHLANWEDDFAFVNGFQHSLTKITSRAIDPAALASQYGIVKTSPAWVDVQRAMQRLTEFRQSGRPYAEQDDDRTVVHAFRTLIEKSGGAIAIALVSAGTLAGLGVRVGITRALREIATGLRFLDISTDDVDTKLHALFDELLKLANMSLPALPRLEQVDSISAWESWVLDMQKSVPAGLHLSKLEQTDFLRSAWLYWKDRLANRDAAKDPGLDVIYCQLTNTGPGKYLSFSLDSMKVVDWSLALVDALELPEDARPFDKELPESPNPRVSRKDVPLWLALVALIRMGFDDETVNRFHALLTRFDISLEVGYTTHRTTSDRTIAGIGIRKGRMIMENWLPAEGCPLIVVSREQVQSLIKNLNRIADVVPQAQFLPVAFVAFETEEEESGSAAPSRARRDPLDGKDLELLRFFGIDPAKPIPVIFSNPRKIRPLGSKYLPIAPQSPRELFAAAALSNPPPAPTAIPAS
jgi:hypothetical protein